MIKRLPLLIAVLALAAWAGNFTIKNFLAVSLIAYGEQGTGTAAAAGYAPANAEVLAARARYLLYRSEEPRAEEAIAVLQQAVAASPRDYRYSLELGKTYDGNGQSQPAETALQRATTLAPGYFEPRWTLANSRLRAGKTEAALDDFREAITLSGALYGQALSRPDRNVALNAFNAISGALGMNLDALRRSTPADSASNSYLAEFLATHDAMEQALEIWRNLPPDDLNSYRRLAAHLTRELQGKNRFHEAREVWRKYSGIEGVPAEDPNNLIANPGFERTPLREKYADVIDLGEGFDWVIRRHPEVRVSRGDDSVHSGAKALHLALVASMSSEFQEVSQLLTLEQDRTYKLSYFVKTKNLPSLPNENPYLEITDGQDSRIMRLRSVLPSGNTEWSEQSITFSTPITHGLRLTIRIPQLKLDRLRTPEFWLDDFKLEKINP